MLQDVLPTAPPEDQRDLLPRGRVLHRPASAFGIRESGNARSFPADRMQRLLQTKNQPAVLGNKRSTKLIERVNALEAPSNIRDLRSLLMF